MPQGDAVDVLDPEAMPAFVEYLPDGVSVIDRHYRIRYMNAALRQTVGDPGETPCYAAIAGRDRPCDYCMLRRVIDRGERVRYRAAPEPGEGFDGTALPVALPSGERVKLEIIHELGADGLPPPRSTANFLASMSHELRSPLNSIIGYAEATAGELFGPIGNDKYREYVESIHQASQHLLALVNDVLEFSLAEVGRLVLEEDDLDVAEVVDAAVRLSGASSAEGVELALDVPEGLPRVLGDARRLRQVLVNLLSNAVKFSEPGGRVTLSARREPGGTVAFAVTDEGIGMDEAEAARAFELYRRAEPRMTLGREGVGIGLALCKQFVEAHAGTITIDSAPGRGTTVLVRLPSWRTRRDS